MAKPIGPGRTKREAANLLARRTEVFRRWRLGENLAAIGASLSPRISKQSASLDCKLALEEFREANRGSISEMVELEWRLLNWIQLEAQQNWEASHDPKQRDKLGDPRWLELAMKCGEHRRKLLGIDKPTKIEQQTTAEVKVSGNFKTLDELRADIRKHQQSLKARKKK